MNDDFVKKEHDVFYITHKMELLVLLIIICVIIALNLLLGVHKKNAEGNFDIFMPDVDGLIVGSPVRMMGVEIGHITKIKPTKDEVYVNFLITKKGITLPQGTQATVEFSGMAGSKSLELYPPDRSTYIDDSVSIITVSPPKRLHDAFGLLNEMFKTLGSIIKTSSYFGAQLKSIDMPIGNQDPQEIEKFLQYANESIDKYTKKAEDFGRKLENERTK